MSALGSPLRHFVATSYISRPLHRGAPIELRYEWPRHYRARQYDRLRR